MLYRVLFYLNAGIEVQFMESSHQKELLLCALKHFDIEVVDAEGQRVMLGENIVVTMTEGQQFQLWKASQREATFNDVVKLCTHIKTHLEWNEKVGVENSGPGQ